MNRYDIVLVSHEKDFNNIKFIVENASKNLDFDSIHLILSEREEYKELELLKTFTDKPIYKHNESDILKIDRQRIKHRPNWIYQMLLKMFQNVTENDNFLVIECDCIILKKINFFNENKTIFYLGRDQNNTPYFNFNQKVLNIGREYNHSFISEFMMYDKKIIKDMLIKANCNSVEQFLELVYEHTNENCYMADYEIYGNFFYKYHNDKFDTKILSYNFYGREARFQPYWHDFEIKNLIENNQDKESISFHTWGLN